MNIQLSLSSQELSDLQQHMARLVKYYEFDVSALGRVESYVEGEVLSYVQILLRNRLKQLDSADQLWDLLTRQ